ncbi:hypothetical protein [Dyadobacter fermentans]|uniref:Uncharacterized protein n=1 Tax=Dyadobacter fermentans (strain ATCC 700827 / DSM 18053 / CIP 107007 / KCTC 52180 / NS114) TaxID=471854 RepID=C6W3B1_DYAFD|nr:hypothetical protein [Dyadobacter fermentans]ACT92215.1 hypothetical protein Dfer_0965 [Dyadobacter fermentans DSM 18053]
MLNVLTSLLLIISLAMPLCAQDTTSIIFSEEAVTLEDQHFVDRYENVFMTKIPTKRIFKLGYTASTYKGMGLTAAVEYKLFPFLSLEAAIYSRAAREGDGIYLDSFFRQLSGRNLFASVGSRWYPNMMRRIARQQSANNFTGSYLSVLYERSVGAIQYGYVRDHFSLSYGFQSRFLTSGFLDFSLGLYYLRPYPEWYISGWPVTSKFRINNLVFASRSLIGLALGDWKRTGSGPLCDVLHCDYLVRQHFKIRLPEVNVGLQNQSIRAEIGYERKIGRSPFSMNFTVRNETDRSTLYGYKTFHGRTEGEGQLRFYYLQKNQVRKGKASDNLSGLYVGARFGYRWEYEHYSHRERYSGRTQLVGISAGYQQRLFHKLYFDSAVSLSGVGYVKSIVKVKSGEVNARAGVGFAF